MNYETASIFARTASIFFVQYPQIKLSESHEHPKFSQEKTFG